MFVAVHDDRCYATHVVRQQHENTMKKSIIHGSQEKVIGRFAPSPTGPMHFGTLLAAVTSYLLVRTLGGRWLLRIEDLDPPRVVAGADRILLLLLEQLGFEWDGPVVYQSDRIWRYHEVLKQLRDKGNTFDCNCTRRQIQASSGPSGDDGPVYPGTCRSGMRGQRSEHAVRLRVPNEEIVFHDGIYGIFAQNLEREVGDFILRRADGLFAYQLAVVVDDLDSGVNQVVRGADLLSSTPRQIWLYRCLGAQPPAFFHHPLALGADGRKLSKSHRGYEPVILDNSRKMMWLALDFLGQMPPPELLSADAPNILRWGVEHFSPTRIPRTHRATPERTRP